MTASSWLAAPWEALLRIMSILLVLAIPVGLILIVVGLLQTFRPEPEPNAEERLRRRYVQGEITQSEFESMRSVLYPEGDGEGR